MDLSPKFMSRVWTTDYVVSKIWANNAIYITVYPRHGVLVVESLSWNFRNRWLCSGSWNFENHCTNFKLAWRDLHPRVLVACATALNWKMLTKGHYIVILRDFKKYTVCARHRVLVVESLSKSKPTVDQLSFVTLIEAGLDWLVWLPVFSGRWRGRLLSVLVDPTQPLSETIPSRQGRVQDIRGKLPRIPSGS